MGMRCLLPSSAGLSGWGLNLQSRCGARWPEAIFRDSRVTWPSPQSRCVAPRVLLLGVAACAASPWGGESSVVPPAFVQTVLPATFVQKKLLPAIFV